MIPQPDRQDRAKGFLLAFLGILILTPDTLIIRLVDAHPWTFLFWRGGLMSAGFALLLVLVYRGRLVRAVMAIGWIGILIALVFGALNAIFQYAVQSTTVANVLVILATAPLFAAIIGWIILGERVGVATWLAIAGSLAGMVLIFAGDLGQGSLLGNLLAVLASIGLGLHLVLIRLARPVDMTPAVALSGPVIAAVGFVAAPDLHVSPDQFHLLFVLGALILPVSFALLSRAPRYIPAAEVSLMSLLETVLGPLWVWLVVGEVPSPAALAGGALVLATLIAYTRFTMRSG